MQNRASKDAIMIIVYNEPYDGIDDDTSKEILFLYARITLA